VARSRRRPTASPEIAYQANTAASKATNESGGFIKSNDRMNANRR
jgi:hypothetical protein